MCGKCEDNSHPDAPASPTRRKVLMAGAGLAAASTLAVMPGKVQAQESAAQAGNGPGVFVHGQQGSGGAICSPKFPPGTSSERCPHRHYVLCYLSFRYSYRRAGMGAPYPATNYPCVPGHEIIGRVAAIGSAVTKFRPGDIAGAGAMIDSCGECESCVNDLEQYCLKGWTLNFNSPDKISGGYNYGGFSQRVVIPERFTVRIPPGMNLAAAAPLMCAGITTFSPLEHWSVEAGQRVGVIGMGGLGHLAVKLAVARRADVTVFTTTRKSHGREKWGPGRLLSGTILTP